MLRRLRLDAMQLALIALPIGGCTFDLPDQPDAPRAAPSIQQPLAAADLAGTYSTNWGPLSLIQGEGGMVGYYGDPTPGLPRGQGRVAGTINGGRFTFVWVGDESKQAGRGWFRLDGRDKLTGGWGYGDDDSGQGAWYGTRVVNGQAPAAASSGAPPAPPPTGSR